MSGWNYSKLKPEQRDLIVELYRLYSEIGRQPTLAQMERVVSYRCGVRISENVIRRAVDKAGIPREWGRAKNSTLDRFGREKLNDVAERYYSGVINAKEAADELDCSDSCARRWLRFIRWGTAA